MTEKRILLVQLYSNGDCLYATTVARQIKHDFPGCRLTWAIAAACRNIIANNPYVDDVEVVTDVAKSDTAAYLGYESSVWKRKAAGEWDEVFITDHIGANLAYYDGSIRSSIFRAYRRPVTVPVTPVLQLTEEETGRVQQFTARHGLAQYDHVVLFEFAPQSGQIRITREMALEITEKIIRRPRTAVILSSAHRIEHSSPAIIDGSSLSLRETAGLTHFCSLLIGCSSGISWISTSSAAKPLPMVQLVDAGARWANPVSRDFRRFHLPVENVIDLVRFTGEEIAACVSDAMADFAAAREKYNQPVPLQFRTTVHIVYNLLCYLRFRAIFTHVRVNREVYGNNMAFYAAVVKGFLIFPFRLTYNLITRRILRTK